MGSAPVQECLRAGLLDELNLHIVPVLLGSGVRLLDHLGLTRSSSSAHVWSRPGVTHVSYRVLRPARRSSA